jgi:ribosomal protein S27AE
MTCHCIARATKALDEIGAYLITTIPLKKGPRPCMLIRAENKKTHKPVTLLATFCPVCGKKYEVAPERPADPGAKARTAKVAKLGKERRKLRPKTCPRCKEKFQAVTGKEARCDICGYWYLWYSDKQRWVKAGRATPPNPTLIRVEDD